MTDRWGFFLLVCCLAGFLLVRVSVLVGVLFVGCFCLVGFLSHVLRVL